MESFLSCGVLGRMHTSVVVRYDKVSITVVFANAMTQVCDDGFVVAFCFAIRLGTMCSSCTVVYPGESTHRLKELAYELGIIVR